MALTYDLTLGSFQSDTSVHNICDTTVWGGTEPARNTRANYLITAYKDVDGNPTYVTTTPLNADPTVVDEWSFDTPRDARYEWILLSTELYAAATAYNTDDVRTYNSLPYIALQDGFQDITPDAANGSDYWKLVEDYKTIVDNASLEQYVYEDIIDTKLRDCLRDELEKAVDNGLCNKGCKTNEITEDFNKIELLVTGANSKNWEQKMSEAEEIIRVATDFCGLQC